MNIEDFYAQDERRRRSAEAEFGQDWMDASGVRHELSWVQDTGELYWMRVPVNTPFEDPLGDVVELSDTPLDAVTVEVIGQIEDHGRLEEVLDGWPEAMTRPNGTEWVLQRLGDAGIARGGVITDPAPSGDRSANAADG